MDTLDELAKGDGKATFISHVFNFEKESKSEMMNVFQYAIIAVVPVVLLNKLMQMYIPDADENKGSLEIIAEVLFQIFVIFIGILFINRMITYVPTYSEMKYDNFNPITIILPTLIIILSLQTKMGDKMSILYERVTELWDKQETMTTKNKNKSSKEKITQPISGQQYQPPPQMMPSPIHTALDGTTGTTSLSQLDQQQQPGNGNNQPSSMDYSEPMAANSGGGGFASW